MESIVIPSCVTTAERLHSHNALMESPCQKQYTGVIFEVIHICIYEKSAI